jgi:Fe-S-cluster containining protein
MRRYFEWDYPNDLVIEYRRDGSCKKCGECCRTRVAWEQSKPFASGKAGGHDTGNNKGVWQEVSTGRWRHFFRLHPIDREDTTSCCNLDGNICTRHKDKPWICREWPFSPICIDSFPECGYSFTEIQRSEISGLMEDDA